MLEVAPFQSLDSVAPTQKPSVIYEREREREGETNRSYDISLEAFAMNVDFSAIFLSFSEKKLSEHEESRKSRFPAAREAATRLFMLYL